jgi:hypothetical protein
MEDISPLTVADCVKLLVNAIDDGVDHCPVVKLFTPGGPATWLISESDPDYPDRLFGLCDLGLGSPELGYVSLSEIRAATQRFGIPVERDMHFVTDKPLSVFASEARERGRIIA